MARQGLAVVIITSKQASKQETAQTNNTQQERGYLFVWVCRLSNRSKWQQKTITDGIFCRFGKPRRACFRRFRTHTVLPYHSFTVLFTGTTTNATVQGAMLRGDATEAVLIIFWLQYYYFEHTKPLSSGCYIWFYSMILAAAVQQYHGVVTDSFDMLTSMTPTSLCIPNSNEYVTVPIV